MFNYKLESLYDSGLKSMQLTHLHVSMISRKIFKVKVFLKILPLQAMNCNGMEVWFIINFCKFQYIPKHGLTYNLKPHLSAYIQWRCQNMEGIMGTRGKMWFIPNAFGKGSNKALVVWIASTSCLWHTHILGLLG